MRSDEQKLDETRNYDLSSLPVLHEDPERELDDTARDTLLVLYGEVCTAWRTLTKARVRVLALVPFLTLAGIVAVFPGTGLTTLTARAGALVGAVGGLLTLGLFVSELRSSVLYDDIVDRGGRIEAELGIHTGLFRGQKRPGANGYLSQSFATFVVFGAAALGWGALIGTYLE